MSLKCFLPFGKNKRAGLLTEFYLSWGVFWIFRFLKNKECYISLRTLREKFLKIGRYLSAGLAKWPPTSPAKHFEEFFFKNCKSFFVFPLRSKSFLTLPKKFQEGFQDCTSLYGSRESALRICFPQKRRFSIYFDLRAEKFNFWLFFFLELVEAEIYASRKFLPKNRSEESLKFGS